MKALHDWKHRLALAAAFALAVQSQAHAGGLSFVEYQPAVGPTSPLRNVEAIAVSWPDGKNVYTAGGNADMLGVYSRDLGTGELTLLEVKEDGVGGVDGLRNNLDVAVSNDSECVYATGQQDGNGKVAVFSRNTTTGALTFVETQD